MSNASDTIATAAADVQASPTGGLRSIQDIKTWMSARRDVIRQAIDYNLAEAARVLAPDYSDPSHTAVEYAADCMAEVAALKALPGQRAKS